MAASYSNLIFVAVLLAAAIASVSGMNYRADPNYGFQKQPFKRDLSEQFASHDGAKCQEITVPMCKNIEYNATSFPNQFNHETQYEAAMEAHQFWALVEINCSKDLRFFLCSMYTPICIPNYSQRIRACKSVCVRARNGCEKYMNKFGFEWPEHMNCDLFPEYGSAKEVCMDPIDAVEQRKKLSGNAAAETTKPAEQVLTDTTRVLKTKEQNMAELIRKQELLDNLSTLGSGESLEDLISSFKVVKPARKEMKASSTGANAYLLDQMCQSPFIKLSANDPNDPRVNMLSTGTIVNCVQPCHSIYFDSWQRSFTFFWLFVWAVVCLASSVGTTCTYLIETSRFKYPERPIIYMSICYLFVSVGYLLRFLNGHEQNSCELDGSIKYHIGANSSAQPSSVGFSSLTCKASFVLTYFFGMASLVWWVIISMTWFLSAGLRWGRESVASYSVYFHLFAWLLPGLQTVIVLAMSLVDGDSLSGLCYVGNLDARNLLVFVIIPSLFYLSLGISFLIAGFINMCRIRKLVKQHQDLSQAHTLEKLMLRIGVFSIIYTVPATFVIVCQFYEQYYRQDWEKNALCQRYQLRALTSNRPADNDLLVKSFCESDSSSDNSLADSPLFSIFMIKYFMSLIIGIGSGSWVCTKKTVKSWRRFLSRVFCCQQSSSAKRKSMGAGTASTKAKHEKKRWLASKLFGKRTSKDSIVYFQANDEMDHHHGQQKQNFYDPASDAVIPPIPAQTNVNMRELENQQHLIEPAESNVNIYYNHSKSSQLVSPMHYSNHAQLFMNTMHGNSSSDHRPPESVISASDTNNSSANSKQFFLTNRYLSGEPGVHNSLSTYESQHYLLQSNNSNNNYHANPAAAAIYYDSSVTSSKPERLVVFGSTNQRPYPSNASRI